MSNDSPISSLYVLLKLDQVEFQSGCDAASKVAEKTAGDIDKSFSSLSSGRGGLRLAEEAIGIRVPRALNNLISQLPGVSSLFTNLLPVLGIIVAIELIEKLIAHHNAMKDAMEAARKAWKDVDDTAEKALYGMDTKMLEVQKGVDELHGKHLEALRLQLEIIDRQNFEKLGTAFDALVKKADESFGKMKIGWLDTVGYFLMGMDEPAKAAAKDFDAWAEGWKDAGEPLQVITEKIVALQKARKEALSPKPVLVPEGNLATGGGGTKMETPPVDKNRVAALDKELGLLQKIQAEKMKGLDLSEAEQAAAIDKANVQDKARGDKDANAVIEGDKKMQDADTALWEARALNALSGQAVTSDVENKITAIKLDAENQRYSNDINAAVAHLNVLTHATTTDKAAITAAQDAIVAMATAHETKLTNLDTEGNNKRFHIQEEADRQRIALQDRMNKEELEHELAMDKLKATAAMQQAKAKPTKGVGANDPKAVLAEEIKAENAEYNAQVAAFKKEISLIDANDKQKLLKETTLNHKIEEETLRHENKISQLKITAERARQKAIEQAEDQMERAISTNIARGILGQQSLADSMKKLGMQMVEDALANTIRLIMIGKMQQIPQAGDAARTAFVSALHGLPFPVNVITAPIVAAAAFESVMSFDQGGIVPSDSLAQVHRNEMVLPPDLSRGLQSMIRGGKGGGNTVNQYITTDHADSFRQSQTQIAAKSHRDLTRMGSRNN